VFLPLFKKFFPNPTRVFWHAEKGVTKEPEGSMVLVLPVDQQLFAGYRLRKDTLPDAPWHTTWGGVRRAARFLDTPHAMLQEYMRWAMIQGSELLSLLDMPTSVVVPFFSDLKQKIHENIDNLPPESRYFIDLQTIAGFPKMSDRETTDNPVEWLSKSDLSEYSSDWWCKSFKKTFYDAIVLSPMSIMSLKEFTISRWMWITPGASSFSKLLLDGELVRTKFGAALSLTDDELWDLVQATQEPERKDMIGVFLKPDEGGYKRRLIANVPLGGYIVASYVRYVIEQFTTADPEFMKFEVSQENKYDVVRLLEEGRLAMPLDESAFDYHVTEEIWLGFFDFLETTFPQQTGISYLRGYYEKAMWHFDGKEGKWLAGMPSGLALTSFLNSWINFVKQKEIIPGDLHWAAGDDTLVFPFDENISLKAVADEYAKFGSVTHPLKNWTSHKYAEFLKTLYSSTGTSGYPARIWGTLMWAGIERPFLPADKLPELAELWKQFFDRLGIPMDEHYVAKDLAASVSKKVKGFNTRVAIQWLHSPKVNGGFGKIPYNDKVFTWDVEVERVSQYEKALIRLPRVLRFKSEVQLVVTSSPLRLSTFRFGRPLYLRPVTSLDEWETRLNNEDLPIRGPFAHLATTTIPLPTVDFISTQNMSDVAKKWGFYALPNIKGSWEATNRRLISGSAYLATFIEDELRTRSISTWC
jgi:hypothetical protein